MTDNKKICVLLPNWIDSMNIYIRELGRAYQRTGCELIYGVDNFYETTVDADIVHLNWPEAFYRWHGMGSAEKRAERFIGAIDKYKNKGAKIVWTVHNLTPHDHVKSGLDYDVYQSVIERADIIAHHCEKSIDLLKAHYKVYDNIENIVLPHGNYLAYPSGITRKEARARLAIPDNAYVYLHFGAIRSYKGLDSLFSVFGKVNNPDKWLLVAGNYQGITGKGAWRDKLLMYWARHWAKRTTLYLKNIPSEDIQIFLAASDCMVLSHSRGLNSGVAVLGMTFGKLIIGPKLGCIEWVLDAGKNISFDVNSSDALIKAMNQAVNYDGKEVNKVNSSIASEWTWDGMVKKILEHPLVRARTANG